jgi:hypothetical protein
VAIVTGECHEDVKGRGGEGEESGGIGEGFLHCSIISTMDILSMAIPAWKYVDDGLKPMFRAELNAVSAARWAKMVMRTA